MSIKEFDLNIQKVLEDWEIFHALREIIANAIDEQLLTDTKDISIFKSRDSWIIRDYGRGLQYEHLTQNENEEKLNRPDLVIGKFGVGLKDALATLDRHKIAVKIRSQFGDITLGQSSKKDFDELITLHALISPPSDPSLQGTEFILPGIIDQDIELAKDFFLKFSNETSLETTSLGQVLDKGASDSRIYINGLRVAEEDNFLFSYNITSLTKAMRKALNRERTHVGRTAYTDRVKAILLDCKKTQVAELLVKDLKKFQTGEIHDELKWIDVSVHACKLLNAQEKVVFVTSEELIQSTDMIDNAQSDGYLIIPIPDNVREKLQGISDVEGNPVRDLEEYTSEWNDSFEFEFVDENQLTNNEREIWGKQKQIFQSIGGRPKIIKEILISKTMRPEQFGIGEASGIWEEHNNRIIIKRDQLRSLEFFAGTLLHEVAHALSGASDVSREFEQELTCLLGKISAKKFG